MAMPLAVAAENPWEKHYTDRDEPLGAETAVSSSETEREAYVITFQQVQDAVAEELTKQGVADRIRATTLRRPDSAIASFREPLTLQIDQLTHDSKQLSWQGVAYFSAGAKTLAPVKIAGRYEEVLEVPILKQRVSNGELITESNIEMQIFGLSRLKGETITSASQLIGKTPNHSISALRPIRADEVISMPVIRKGESVSVLYKTPAMEIKTIGEALENGAAGDTIKIRNPESHVVIQATITEKGVAQILPSAPTTSVSTPSTPTPAAPSILPPALPTPRVAP